MREPLFAEIGWNDLVARQGKSAAIFLLLVCTLFIPLVNIGKVPCKKMTYPIQEPKMPPVDMEQNNEVNHPNTVP